MNVYLTYDGCCLLTEMTSGDVPKRTTLGMRVCTTLGAYFGGGIDTLVWTEWAPSPTAAAAAIGASLGGKAGGTVR
jgi:hypothetical protein